ncbi:MAG: hypothetical protein CMD87_02330 [Gammaproteobacteria bacterium]|nr:hypothetical protein [Gammaproteobacteria bacterium]
MSIFANIFYPLFENSLAGFGTNLGILKTMKTILASIVILGSSLFLGACGQTGPLFLPDQPNKTVDGRN